MTVYFNDKCLDITSAIRTNNGDIEAFCELSQMNNVYLVEYELEWFIVIENKRTTNEPNILRYTSYKVDNQIDIYKLNASL